MTANHPPSTFSTDRAGQTCQQSEKLNSSQSFNPRSSRRKYRSTHGLARQTEFSEISISCAKGAALRSSTTNSQHAYYVVGSKLACIRIRARRTIFAQYGLNWIQPVSRIRNGNRRLSVFLRREGSVVNRTPV